MQAKLRLGSGEQTLLCALGHAAAYSEKRSSPAISAKSLEDVSFYAPAYHLNNLPSRA